MDPRFNEDLGHENYLVISGYKQIIKSRDLQKIPRHIRVFCYIRPLYKNVRHLLLRQLLQW